MIKKLLGNLWFWVISAFLCIIIAWGLTMFLATKHQPESLKEGEVLERQIPEVKD
jgi:hypothetical protein